jgi:hypothetical protein
MPSPYPAARVAVDAETWTAFRQLALRRGLTVSEYLARFVVAETARERAPSVARIDPDAPIKDQSLEALSAARENIDELTDIAGRLARAAFYAGCAWPAIGERLRMSEADVRRAFEKS